MSCGNDYSTSIHNLTSKTVSDLSIHKNLLVVTGTAEDSTLSPGIKSPFRLYLHPDFSEASSVFTPTETTAIQPFSFHLGDSNISHLAYYRATSLRQQEEKSYLHYFNSERQALDLTEFGNRTRIGSIVGLDENRLIALSYERETQKMSLRFMNKQKIEHEISFAESNQTNIPTGLVVLPNKEILFSGIADGFHYPDGHNYSNPQAYGFIFKTDSEGNILNQYTHSGNGHVFIHGLHTKEDFIYAGGTYQSDSTGMDLLSIKLDQNLNPLWTRQITRDGIQEVKKILAIEQDLYLLSNDEQSDHNMRLQLSKLNNDGELIWQKHFGEHNYSYEPIDMTLFEKNLYIASNAHRSRITSPSIFLFKIDLDGVLLDEKIIQ